MALGLRCECYSTRQGSSAQTNFSKRLGVRIGAGAAAAPVSGTMTMMMVMVTVMARSEIPVR